MVVRERLTEPRVTIEGLLAKPRSFSNLPAFLDVNGRIVENSGKWLFCNSRTPRIFKVAYRLQNNPLQLLLMSGRYNIETFLHIYVQLKTVIKKSIIGEM